MSYNTEYTGYSDGRVPGFGVKISEVAPDVVGLQECQDANALAAAAPGYTVLGGTVGAGCVAHVRRCVTQRPPWFMAIVISTTSRCKDETLARPRRAALTSPRRHRRVVSATYRHNAGRAQGPCLLYTSDAADE